MLDPERVGEAAADLRQRHPILRPARPRQARLDRVEVEVERLGVGRRGLRRRCGRAPAPCVALDQGDQLGRAAGVAQVAQRLRRRPGTSPAVAPNSGDMLDSVARSATVSEPRPGPKNSMNLPTTPCLRSCSVSVSTRSVAVTPVRSAPAMRTPTTCGGGHVERLAEHDGLGLDPADAPAEHAERVDHRGVRVGADQRVGQRDAVAHRRRRGRGTRGSPGGRCPCPAARRGSCGTRPAPSAAAVALAVSLVLALDVARVGARSSRTRPPARSGRSTRSTGTSGSTREGSPPRRATAARIAARSTTAGTPVRSCIITRAGMKASCAPSAGAGQPASARTSASVTCSVPARRTRFSSSTHTVYGQPRRVRDRIEAIDRLPRAERAARAERVGRIHACNLSRRRPRGRAAEGRTTVDLDSLTKQAKKLVDQRGGVDALKGDAEELKDIAGGAGARWTRPRRPRMRSRIPARSRMESGSASLRPEPCEPFGAGSPSGAWPRSFSAIRRAAPPARRASRTCRARRRRAGVDDEHRKMRGSGVAYGSGPQRRPGQELAQVGERRR